MPTTLNQYTLGRTLGSGVSCKVKLAKDDAGTRYAIKILHSDEQFQELIQTEVQTLQSLNHPNIVNLVEVSSGTQNNPKKGSKNVKFIVLELVGGGELFDFVALGGRLDEGTARHYFGQLLDGLKYMHGKGFAHRDLKPENLMLDKHFNLKIADFGFAAPIAGRDGSGMLETQLGTASYMAPEIYLGKAYTGQAVDLFAATIILFVILTQRPPFSAGRPDDPHFRLLAGGKANLFWQAHAEAEEGKDIYSAEFKDLFEKMMQLDPANRLSLDQILAHPWMSGSKPSPSAVTADFERRKKIVDEEAHNEREEKRQRRRDAGGVRRSNAEADDDANVDENQAWQELEIEEYGAYYKKDTAFFTTGKPVDMFATLVKSLEKQNIEVTVNDSKLKLKFTTQISCGEESEGEEESKQDAETKEVQVCFQVFQVDEDKHCGDFTYKDAKTRHHLTSDYGAQEHYLKVRQPLNNFIDTTFDAVL